MADATTTANRDAGVTLVKGDVTGIVRALRLSRATTSKIRRRDDSLQQSWSGISRKYNEQPYFCRSSAIRASAIRLTACSSLLRLASLRGRDARSKCTSS